MRIRDPIHGTIPVTDAEALRALEAITRSPTLPRAFSLPLPLRNRTRLAPRRIGTWCAIPVCRRKFSPTQTSTDIIRL